MLQLRQKLLVASGVLALGIALLAANCPDTVVETLSAAQIRLHLNEAGYAPLWAIRHAPVGYHVEGIDPAGNPVLLLVDPVTAAITASELLSLLR